MPQFPLLKSQDNESVYVPYGVEGPNAYKIHVSALCGNFQAFHKGSPALSSPACNVWNLEKSVFRLVWNHDNTNSQGAMSETWEPKEGAGMRIC